MAVCDWTLERNRKLNKKPDNRRSRESRSSAKYNSKACPSFIVHVSHSSIAISSLPNFNKHLDSVNMSLAEFVSGGAFGSALLVSGVYIPEVIKAQMVFSNNHMLMVFLGASATSA